MARLAFLWHAAATLRAGFTTLRDLGTEGAGYADVALKRAIEEGIVPGPRLFVAGRQQKRRRAAIAFDAYRKIAGIGMRQLAISVRRN